MMVFIAHIREIHMKPVAANAALILIDVQEAFEDPSWGERNNPAAENNIAALLAAWRAASRPVIHVHHRSLRPGSLFHPDGPGFVVKQQARPRDGEPVLYKDVNSGFIGTGLEERLRADGIGMVVIAGITTDHCVSTTVRMAGNLGFETLLVGDAAATFARVGPTGRRFSAEEMHQSALASIHGEFAQVVRTSDIVGQALRARQADQGPVRDPASAGGQSRPPEDR